jgi:hypothetical protein
LEPVHPEQSSRLLGIQVVAPLTTSSATA